MTAALIVWAVGGLVLALGIGRAIRIADEREGTLPARLDPRAGQHTAKAAPAAFTAVLFAVALVALGVAQQIPGGPA